MVQLLGLISGLLVLVAGMAAATDEPAASIACRLSPGGFSARMGEIETLFSVNEEIRELEDGYAFRFPGDADWGAKLLRFIEAERQCCRFFRFELSFEPNHGPVWLRVGGSEEVKSFLTTLIQGAEPRPGAYPPPKIDTSQVVIQGK